MNKSSLFKLRQILAASGHNLTKARQLTFNLLDNPKPSAISQLIVKSSGHIDRVSIYRNIELFEQLGIVNRINIGFKAKFELSDQFLEHHHHLNCLNCGLVIDIKDERHIDNFIKTTAKSYGFVPSTHQFEIEGWCRTCQAKRQLVLAESSS